jgi:hypothetical protein
MLTWYCATGIVPAQASVCLLYGMVGDNFVLMHRVSGGFVDPALTERRGYRYLVILVRLINETRNLI